MSNCYDDQCRSLTGMTEHSFVCGCPLIPFPVLQQPRTPDVRPLKRQKVPGRSPNRRNNDHASPSLTCAYDPTRCRRLRSRESSCLALSDLKHQAAPSTPEQRHHHANDLRPPRAPRCLASKTFTKWRWLVYDSLQQARKRLAPRWTTTNFNNISFASRPGGRRSEFVTRNLVFSNGLSEAQGRRTCRDSLSLPRPCPNAFKTADDTLMAFPSLRSPHPIPSQPAPPNPPAETYPSAAMCLETHDLARPRILSCHHPDPVTIQAGRPKGGKQHSSQKPNPKEP